MSKKQFKSQANSSRAAQPGNFGFGSGFGSPSTAFGSASSPLSYLAEQPDLSTILDANVVVSFKNLSKKDSVTKAKALDELQTYATSLRESNTETDDALLNAWIKVYPRASIDIDRRVRQLAHTTHGLFISSSGKKAARCMPSCIGAWFSGCHDNDRSVSKAAVDAFTLVFPTPEKQEGISRVYQLPIIEFCRDALLNETVRSLSDERITKEEDAEAKHARLISSSLSVLSSLLEKLPTTETQKHSQVYEEILQSDKLWSFTSSKDSNVRRTLYRLLRVASDHVPDLVESQSAAIFEALLSKSAIKRQGGSALDYARALLALATARPDVWSKVSNKLPDLLKHGSQGASGAYWAVITQLWATIPQDLLPTTADATISILSSLKNGITRKEEPRSNAEEAWSCYIAMLESSTANLTPDDQAKVISEMGIPLLHQYLSSSSADASWTVPAPQAVLIMTKLMRIPVATEGVCTSCRAVTAQLIDDIRTSAPEQSKEFQASQTSLAKAGARWFQVRGKVLDTEVPGALDTMLEGTTSGILQSATATLEARSGKPFGAAEVIESYLKFSPEPLDPASMAIIDKFLIEILPGLVLSPSQHSLIAILYHCQRSPSFDKAWDKTVDTILGCKDATQKSAALRAVLLYPTIPKDFSLAAETKDLQAYFSQMITDAISGTAEWQDLAAYLAAPYQTLSQANLDMALSRLTDSLSLEAQAPAAISGLQLVATQKPEFFQEFLKSSEGSNMLQSVLSLSESTNESVAGQALELNNTMSRVSLPRSGESSPFDATRSLIEQGLSQATPTSLGIETLIEFARRELRNHKESASTLARQILPGIDAWARNLQLFLDQSIQPAIAVSSLLGSALPLISQPQMDSTSVGYDKEGISAAFRTALFVIEFISEDDIWKGIPLEEQAEIYRVLLLTSQVANDCLTLARPDGLISATSLAAEHTIVDFLAKTTKLFGSWLSLPSDGFINGLYPDKQPTFLTLAHERLLRHASNDTNHSFHSARALALNVSSMIETSGWASSYPVSVLEEKYKVMCAQSMSLAVLAFVKAFEAPFSNSKAYARTCNEFIATLTATKIESEADVDRILPVFVFLEVMLAEQTHILEAIPKPRLVFFVNQIVKWLSAPAATTPLRIQVAKLLSMVLPEVKTIYGTWWAATTSYISTIGIDKGATGNTFPTSTQVPLIHSCLKLASVLQAPLREDEGNEDLEEAWQSSHKEISRSYLKLLQDLPQYPDVNNQPLRTLNDLLGRQIAAVSGETLQDPSEFYHLVTADSASIHKTAFGLLHGRIPALQEQISIDVVLEKSTARISDELLSLVIEAPTVDTLSDASFERGMSPQVRGYLSGWLLIFDHFKKASEKVCEDYTTQLREGGYLSPLLDFMFDFLGHSRGRPIDASVFDISIYSFDVQDNAIKDTEWLLIHLYFLALKRLSNQTKSWLSEQKSRQTVVNVESWTEKYISPAVITDALATVNAWSSAQDSKSDDAMTIKINPRAHEITLSKDLDAQLLAASLRLPPNFPLGLVTCSSINRVAVDPKKWQAWLINMQGVITFSNNSLIDGIVAFRRNVNGALKGHVECAICYSIVGPDKQLPTKKCGTCRNAFHGNCLYRWFKSSNSSSCPLCRNPFNYS